MCGHWMQDLSVPRREAFLIPAAVHMELSEGWSQIRCNVVVVTDPEIAPTKVERELSDTTA